jgi:hypothetical protein
MNNITVWNHIDYCNEINPAHKENMLNLITRTNWPKNMLACKVQYYSGAKNMHHALISISFVFEFQVSLILDGMSRKLGVLLKTKYLHMLIILVTNQCYVMNC